MFFNGFGAAHAIRVEPRRGFTVLITGFAWPALPIQGDNPLGTPVGPLGHHYHRRASQLRAFAAHHQADFAEPRDAHGQGNRPLSGLPHGHCPVCRMRDERDELCHRHMGSCQPEGVPCRSLQDKAVGLQVPVLFPQAKPVVCPRAGPGHELFRKLPTVEQEDTNRYFGPTRSLQERNAHIALGPNLRVELLKGWVLQHDRINVLREACPFLLLCRDRAVRKGLVDKIFPPRDLFVAPIQTEGAGQAHGAADLRTRDWLVGEGIGGIARVVRAVHIVEQTPHMFAQCLIEDQRRGRLRTAHRLRLLKQILAATVLEAVWEPGGLGEETGQIALVGTLQPTAGHVRQAFVVQDDQPGQVILAMMELAPILKAVSKHVRVGGH